MISVMHASQDELIGEDDEFLIPAGGHRMEMDWERVCAAFQAAVERLGWDADLEIRPERQYVMVRFRGGSPAAIAAAMGEFYDHVEESIGTATFMSIWVDFSFRPVRGTCSPPQPRTGRRVAPAASPGRT